MMAYAPILAAIISMLTVIIVAAVGFSTNYKFDQIRRSHEYKKYKLEQIQKSLDELLRTTNDLLRNILQNSEKAS